MKFTEEKHADTFLNFENISLVCHHGKTTALYLIELCKWFMVDFFVISDWDFELNELGIESIAGFSSFVKLKADSAYTQSSNKAMVTNNWNLINSAGIDKIHFNAKKLETVIGYSKDDKNSWEISKHLNSNLFSISPNLFPEKLEMFLGLNCNSQPCAVDNGNNDFPF